VASSDNLKPKVFVIDDQAEYRRLLGHHITSRWPDAVVKQYDPVASGNLPESFSGAGNDMVLLGHPVGAGDALEWLRLFCKSPGFPPVIFIGDGEERQIVEAMKIGAADYISRERLNHQRLIELMEDSLAKPKENLSTSDSGRFFVDAQQIEDAGLPSLKGYEFKRRLVVNELSAVYLVCEESSGSIHF
jgi:DNA-binding NtrC family response regulator